ncbi:hypothetical protein K2X33_04540 [bacterium]|nr:hypothetical protein [bacterium]
MIRSLTSLKSVSLAVVGSFLLSPVAMASEKLSAEQQAAFQQVIAKEIQTLQGLSNRRVVTEFENLSALIYGENTRDLLKVDENSTKEQKDRVAKILVRYSALKAKVQTIPRAKEETFVKLFGDRDNSPYYGAVTQDEFKDEGYLFAYWLTGSPIFLILYVLANMDNK